MLSFAAQNKAKFEPSDVYLLMWPTWACTAGQRIVLFLSVPNRHNYNFGRVCPKQGILISCESVPPKVRCLFLMFITAVCFLFLVKLRWLKRQEYLRFMIISGLFWERRCHTGRFATTILTQHILQHCCDITSNGCNIVPTLLRCVAQKIGVANRPL